MVISGGIGSPCEAGESVEVELTLEGSQLGLTKVPVACRIGGKRGVRHRLYAKRTLEKGLAVRHLLGHDMLDKLLGLVNDEATSMRLPRDDVSKSIGFYLVQYAVEFDREGDGNSALAAFPVVGLGFHLIQRVIVIIVMHKVSIVHFCRLSRLLGLATTFGTRLFRRRHHHVGLSRGKRREGSVRLGNRRRRVRRTQALTQTIRQTHGSRCSQRDRLLRAAARCIRNAHGEGRFGWRLGYFFLCA